MDHFAEAERLVTPRKRWFGGHAEPSDVLPSQADIERAKVHATLALVQALRDRADAEERGDQ